MDDTEKFIAEVMGMVLLLVALSLFGLAWFLIHTISVWLEEQEQLYDSQSIFDRIHAEAIPNVEADPLFSAVFGVGVGSNQAGAAGTDDWLIRMIFDPV